MKKSFTNESLGEFLRARRERLTPEEVGLPSYGRRRTLGLRREEVAQLAHISTSWYTSLEQGRVVNPSEQVLDGLSEGLRLSMDERRHLHMLASQTDLEKDEVDQEVSTGLERTVFALEPNPAFILGRSWDLLMWNKAAEVVFRLPVFSKEMQQRPNWLRRFLTDPTLQKNNLDWEEKARVMIARFRADYVYCQHDPRFKELIEEFMQISELFRSCWLRHDVQVITDCHKRWSDSLIGEMEFEHVTLQQPNYPALKIMIYIASPSTAEHIKSLLRS
ncbi:helix-turn-helix transcriptional regulator [Paenibacillus dokdonensis]|uniref:Helix-turn-helix transcriptional regulator n=1 Tax=Paenibacillus dokdonensis TaxID=2567944 RepID=A0ABU6GU72_9BACL|nr:helix-turn-helix transcriptional regulator [Paenibacillus dokdonensis]MEC0243258.1 helix-turn-helix transcriptional regulator [Paenibacillus dokdonensis]